MGNTNIKPLPRNKNKKQVHWKATDHPSPPGKPYLLIDNDLSTDLLTIRWSKPIRNGGSPITGYLVEQRKTGSHLWTRATPHLVTFPELILSGLESGWRYQFRVLAENAVGFSDPSEISEITIHHEKYSITPPKFTEELKNETILENEKTEFRVHYLGHPVPKICWFKDGFEIFSSRRTKIFAENGKSILTIHQTALSDEGEIKCTATNKAGHASTKAKLIVEASPSVRLPRQYEEGLLFEIGEIIRLKVSVAGRPTPLIFWSHNGKSIQNDDRYEIEYVNKCSILKINEALRSDRGEYQIKVVNKIGEDTASFLVTVTDKPSPPGKAKVIMTLGRSVTLSWNTPDDDGGCKIGNYIIEYYRLGWNVWLKAATSRQQTTILGDLIEGSEYKFRIKAESPYGVSEPSEESDIIFIPDPKRGMISPRSRSQPGDDIPIAAKRKQKLRSLSSSRFPENMNDSDTPKRPDRNKIKSPPKTPEISPSPIRKEFLDRASITRELSYGSPDIKVKKLDVKSPIISSSENSFIMEDIYKPNENKSEFPSLPKLPTYNEKKVLLKDTSENISGSSEFMLVLYPEDNDKDKKQRNFELYSYDDSLIPPPLSLSAPELGNEYLTDFEQLKSFYSSTALLHERAMIRFYDEISKDNKRSQRSNFEIPKIQINFKDDQDIVGLDRRNSLNRRLSIGGLWTQRRYSLRNPNELNDIISNKVESKQKMKIKHQRSESEEKEEKEFEKVRQKMASQGQSSIEKKKIEIFNEEKWMEDYEESLSEDSSFSEEGSNLALKKYCDEEEEDIYHPGIMSASPELTEPFEILTKKNKLPDPNFKPKPILKKPERIDESSIKPKNFRSRSPMPQNRERSKSLIPQTEVISTKKQRSFSLISSKIKEKNEENESSNLKRNNYSISAVAQISGLTAASVVISQPLLNKQQADEEAKVVIDYYGDIVKNYENKRRASGSLIERSKKIENVSKDSIETFSTVKTAILDNCSQLTTEPKFSSMFKKESMPKSKQNELSLQDEQIKKEISSEPQPKPFIKEASPQSIINKETSSQSIKKNLSPSPRKKLIKSFKKSQSKSSTVPENWSGERIYPRSSSPRPSSIRKKSPIPFAKSIKPKLKEIMTQTSFRIDDRRRSSLTPEMIAKTESNVRTIFDYVTDLAMFSVACWLFLFDNELLAIPIMLIMVYRQLKYEIVKRLPKWLLKKINTKSKK